MAEKEEQLPPIHSFEDIENAESARMAAVVAELHRRGHVLTSEYLERLWWREAQKVQEQMQERREKKRRQFYSRLESRQPAVAEDGTDVGRARMKRRDGR